MSDLRAEAEQWLVRLTGNPAATFRPDQFEAIEAAVERGSRQLLVQRTGWGKSGVYFIATRLLRDRGAGPTMLVSPLLALMRNQIDAAERMGLRAVTINSTNRDDWAEIQRQLDDDEIDLLLISAPRLANLQFQQEVLPTIGQKTGLLVVDEAHCISDWGHDFVPDYRRIVRVLDRLPRGVPVLCCTATANDRVVADIEAQLGDDIVTRRGPLHRESLELHVIELPSPAQRLAWLRRHLPDLPGTGIVYCLTVADAERIARCLALAGIDVAAYTGRTDELVRIDIEERLLANDLKAVIATSALGMGFDKPDLGFVVHYQSPGTPIAYYQQVGRAGRSLDHSYGVLLRGAEDADIQDWFINNAFPDPDAANAVVGYLEDEARPIGVREIEARVNVGHSRLEGMLKVLEVEGALERVDGGYRRTLAKWTYDHDRVDGVNAARREEQQQMREYAATGQCRMAFLGERLDDPHADRCGRCDNCRSDDELGLHDAPATADVVAAIDCLRRNEQVIAPRRQWPSGLGEPKGRIPAERQCQPGRVLSVWGDGGWGDLVRQGRQSDGRFADDLVDAAVELIEGWGPDPDPTWVTCVPSRRHPELVSDAAERIAEQLGLPFVAVLGVTRAHQPQTGMANSAQQVRNVWGAFAVEGTVPSGPVLLIDDILDSGWTLTVLGDLLARAGVPAVHPFALCKATG